MAKINSNYNNLPENYLFSEINRKTKAFQEKNPGIELLKLGIGNTTEPLTPAVVEGLKRGVEKLADIKTYTGYGDEQGSTKLREAVAKFYAKRGISIDTQEIFISDGAKADTANISSIFSEDSVVAISDPVYPAYLDSNIIGGKKTVLLPSLEENNFFPELPKERVDLIFICSPNNPTGSVATKEQLKALVEYAIKNRSVIIFDAAYSEFISDPSLPKSIYEIEGAKKCAIEIQSFSKMAGFTGVRLGWTIVPLDLMTEGAEKGKANSLWHRRQTTMFNGASNIAQEGGTAALSEEGQNQCQQLISYYMENAKVIKRALDAIELKTYGGENAPYVWVKCPNNLNSWEFFDKLLNECQVVTTPGSGFGKMGEGYIRFSAFGHKEDIQKAVESIKGNLKL